MSFNEDAVLAKFSALAETQDSIVSIAQWVRFKNLKFVVQIQGITKCRSYFQNCLLTCGEIFFY